MSVPLLKDFDPGPLARFEEIKSNPNSMDMIAQLVADGTKAKEIAKAWEIPFGKLMLWIESDDQRSQMYWAAVAWHAHERIDESGALADDAEPAEVPKVKLQLGQRQWAAERLFKNRYAPRAEHTGANGAPLPVVDEQEIARRILFTMRLADRARERVVAEVPAVIAAPLSATATQPALEPI